MTARPWNRLPRICLAIPLICAFACGQKNVGEQPGSAPSEAPKISASPDYSLSARAFAEEYKKDPNAAQDKYRGKLVELKGELHGVSRDPYDSDESTFMFFVEGVHERDPYIRCRTTMKRPWREYARGQEVAVAGVVDQYPYLKDCKMMKSGPNPAIAITAGDLAKEFARGADETVKKYEKKCLIIEGEVLRKVTDDVDTPNLVLKGNGDVNVTCQLAFKPAEAEAKSVQIGQKVKVVWMSPLISGREDGLQLGWCQLYDAP
jgi:hypothetical protein